MAVGSAFEQVGVEAVLRGIDQFGRDANNYNRLIDRMVATTTGGARQMSAVSAAQQTLSAANVQVARAEAAAQNTAAESAIAHAAAAARLAQPLATATDRARNLTMSLINNAQAYERVSVAAQANLVMQQTRQGEAQVGFDAAATAQQAALVRSATMGIATALAAVGVMSVKIGADYNTAMTLMANRTQATSAEMAALDVENRRLTADMGFSVVQSANLEKALARAGVSAKDMGEGAARSAEVLARATGEDMTLSATALANSMAAFNKNGKESIEVAAALASVVNNTAMNLQRAEQVITMFQAGMHSLNFSIGDMAALMTAAGKAGNTNFWQGISIQNLFTQLMNPGKDAIRVINEFGLSLEDSEGKARPMLDIMGALHDAFSEEAIEAGRITKVERDRALGIVFGRDALQSALPIINQSTQALEAYKRMGEDVSRVQREAAANTHTFGAEWQKFISSIGASAARVGAPIAGAITNVLGASNRQESINQRTAQLQNEISEERVAARVRETGESYQLARYAIAYHTATVLENVKAMQFEEDGIRQVDQAERTSSQTMHDYAAEVAHLIDVQKQLANETDRAATSQFSMASAAAAAQAQITRLNAQATGTGNTPTERAASQAANTAAADVQAARDEATAVVAAAAKERDEIVQGAEKHIEELTVFMRNHESTLTEEQKERLRTGIAQNQQQINDANAKYQQIFSSQYNALNVANAQAGAATRGAAQQAEEAFQRLSRSGSKAFNTLATSAKLDLASLTKDLDRMKTKAERDFADMAQAYHTRVGEINAQLVQRSNEAMRERDEKIMQAERNAAQNIADAQAAEGQRRVDARRRRDFQEQQQAERDAFSDELQLQENAYNQQERARRDHFSDILEEDRAAYEHQKRLKEAQIDYEKKLADKSLDAKSLAQDEAELGRIRDNQLRMAHTDPQRDLVQRNYAVNIDLLHRRGIEGKKQIDKEYADEKDRIEKQEALRVEDRDFAREQRTEQEAFEDEATLRQQAHQRDVRAQQQAFDKQLALETIAFEDQLSDEALARQIHRIEQERDRTVSDAKTAYQRRHDEIVAEYDSELAKARTIYEQQVAKRRETLAEELQARIDTFAKEMDALNSHFTDEMAALVEQDAAITGETTRLSADVTNQLQSIIDRANLAAAAMAKVFNLPAPTVGQPGPSGPVGGAGDIPIPTGDPGPGEGAPPSSDDVPVGHTGMVIGGLPGSEKLIRAMAGEILLQPGTMGLPPSNTYNANTVNNNYSFAANYSQAPPPIQLQHDIAAIMALAKG